ncbi:unnamed protein product [Adineta ricciae]|uniref:RBR-type E3 ubiquitin transferase n=1 Tax=Adineta ricciae TaxID=249248 RepID=A0A816AV01_ADIRI|nr:unnamed protein product [Adineta ricciae]
MSDEYLSSWTETSTTPPLRRIPMDMISNSMISNEQIHIHRNLSYSVDSLKKLRKNSYYSVKQSFDKLKSFSSNDDSLESIPSHIPNNDDDDRSSYDEINQSEQLILHDLYPEVNSVECEICFEDTSTDDQLPCCSSSICPNCVQLHLSTNINEGQIRILCPSCSHIFTHEEILLLLSKNDPNGKISERYKQFYADMNGELHIKTCPKCCSIKEIDKRLVEGIRWKKTIPRQVICEECQFEWCFFCHAPWHEKMSCKEYQKGEKMFRLWASQIDQNQHNAQKCPRCKVYISRNGGCPHMVCSKCQCDFCYSCGRRRLGVKFFGSHDSRYSPLGCKYNLYPNKPILRHTVRGLVTGVATLAVPVAIVGAMTILAVGTTIALPTYGTYRLIKHIRFKRYERQRRQQTESIPRQWATNDGLSTYVNGINERNTEENHDDDAMERAIQASLVTFREETMRRDEENDVMSYSTEHARHSNQSDLDDDSLYE